MRRCGLLLLVCLACTGATGDHLVTFAAAAAGPADLGTGAVEFDSAAGYHVRLDRARLHIGAVYLNQTVSIAGAQATSCILPGVYVAEVTSGLDVDLLSSKLQPFPVSGEGTTLTAQAGEVWLTGGDVNADVDKTVILDLAGTAARGTDQFPLQGTIRIGKNWALPPPNETLPGAHPICKQRIVAPIPANLAVGSGGTLVVRADPRALLADVDFADLSRSGDVYRFDDGPTSTASRTLFTTLHYASVYRFAWVPTGAQALSRTETMNRPGGIR